MHELLAPTRPEISAAYAACQRYLIGRWPPWRWMSRALSATVQPDVLALATWHTLVRDAQRSAPTAVRTTLSEELEAALGNEAHSPLAKALSTTIRRHSLSALAFRGPLQAWQQEDHVHTYATRDELVRSIRRSVHPEGRLMLQVFALREEKHELLADALGTGLSLVERVLSFREEFARGRLTLPVEDLVACGSGLDRMQDGMSGPEMRSFVRLEMGWARENLARGWPLTEALGARHGRVLAFFLRWHAARLSGLEARNYDLGRRTPGGSRLRFLACLSASLLTRASPFR